MSEFETQPTELTSYEQKLLEDHSVHSLLKRLLETSPAEDILSQHIPALKLHLLWRCQEASSCYRQKLPHEFAQLLSAKVKRRITRSLTDEITETDLATQNYHWMALSCLHVPSIRPNPENYILIFVAALRSHTYWSLIYALQIWKTHFIEQDLCFLKPYLNANEMFDAARNLHYIQDLEHHLLAMEIARAARDEPQTDTEVGEREQFINALSIGEVVSGTVAKVTSIGCFVTINGQQDALLHQNNISWEREAEIPSIGQQLQVVILELDANMEHISVGLKQLVFRDQLTELSSKYCEGTTVEATVTDTTTIKATVEMEPGIHGSISREEVSLFHQKLQDVIKPGNQIKVLVYEVNPEKMLYNVSLKRLQTDPWTYAETHYKIGQKIQGPVTSHTPYGLFLEIEPGLTGMVHISEIAWDKPTDLKNLYAEGQIVEAIILAIKPEAKKIQLSMKSHITDRSN
jgi:predicted RNA-binding protein with RPS1 domain